MGLLGSLPLAAVTATTGLLGRELATPTTLSSEDEQKYRAWLLSIGQVPGQYNIDENGNGLDYDLRGFFKKYGPVAMKEGQHFTDEFKLPNHKTFSNESVYYNDTTAPYGGAWVKGRKGFLYVPNDEHFKQAILEP